MSRRSDRHRPQASRPKRQRAATDSASLERDDRSSRGELIVATVVLVMAAGLMAGFAIDSEHVATSESLELPERVTDDERGSEEQSAGAFDRAALERALERARRVNAGHATELAPPLATGSIPGLPPGLPGATPSPTGSPFGPGPFP